MTHDPDRARSCAEGTARRHERSHDPTEGRVSARQLGILALVALAVTLLWLLFLIAGQARSGPIDSFESALAYASAPDSLYVLTYLNAALTVMAASLFFAGLSAYYRRKHPLAATAGLIFVPVYAALNLVVYLAQLTAVPQLVALRADPATQPAAEAMLQLLIQAWPGSAAAFFNGLAYALLGIPSILFGLLLARRPGARRTGGVLLALNGVACIIGVVGLLFGSALLSNGAVLGGVLFLGALVALSTAFLKE
jgi:hypothetical protein